MTNESTILIGLLLPEVLGTYSDAGNAAVLAARLRWRGIPAEILAINGDCTPPATCDVYCSVGARTPPSSSRRTGCADTPNCGTP